MHVGVLRIELFVSDSNSLKAKRAVMKSLKDRIRNDFNVSVSEVDSHDKWQKAALGVAAVGPDGKYINGILDKTLDLIRASGDVQVLDFEMEIL